MKKKLIGFLPSGRNLKKLLLIMRLSVILILFTTLSAVGSVYSQTAKVNLELRNASLVDVQQQTEFAFFYKNEHLPVNRTYNVTFSGARIDKVLDEVLEGTGLIYRVLNKDIVITKGEKSDSGREDLFSQQQTKTITGKVTDQGGQPLPGVTVLIKGTTQGTVTNPDGEFSLINVPENAIVQFSFVGMNSQEVPAAGKQTINVVMQEEVLGLDEVIVIGYGTAKRKDYTGSVSSVKMEGSPLSIAPNLNALETLKGNVSGLNVGATNTAGGQPSMIDSRPEFTQRIKRSPDYSRRCNLYGQPERY
jgi:hypothetical protein